ncbi:MAG: hypothetical protein ISS71_06870 [Phycisphaerae bacterium]|nr:hypothetical protein [Phycisphaerae bacterium]
MTMEDSACGRDCFMLDPGSGAGVTNRNGWWRGILSIEIEVLLSGGSYVTNSDEKNK